VKSYYQDDWATIYLGDCREILPQIETADMIFTDPPYGHNNNDGDLISKREAALSRGNSPMEEYRPIANDGPEANDLFRFLLAQASRILKDGACCCCCCGGGGPDPQFARWSLWMDEILQFKMCVVWDKGGLGMGWHYRRCWECVLVGHKKNQKVRWHGGNDVPNIIRHVGKIIPNKNQHPTEKPWALPAFFIRLHTLPGDVVLDPFMGHGSTLRAAKDLNRKSIGIEISEAYCEMAARRLAQEVFNFTAAAP
jgi:site-specific DNA-methyltransferase (adenine-specific)